MKSIEGPSPQTAASQTVPFTVRLYRGLVYVLIALVVILAAGTVYGFVKHGRTSPPLVSSGGENLFTGLGAMRIPTSDPEPETILISVAFPYNKNDRPFSEELASRLSVFKAATAEYLGAFSSGELAALDTDTINAELLSRYNSILRLGKIRELYILEYMRL